MKLIRYVSAMYIYTLLQLGSSNHYHSPNAYEKIEKQALVGRIGEFRQKLLLRWIFIFKTPSYE